MRVIQLHILLQIVVAVGRNQLANAKLVLHLYRRLCADLTEKLLQLYLLADRLSA
jgi:hypothetical protein